MVTPAAGNQHRQDVAEERAQAPIRWPHPNSHDISLVGLWAVGIFVALFLPALFVAPTANPIADASRYHTPNSFSSSVYTTNVSVVFDTPTIPNLTNWTRTCARVERSGPATLVVGCCDSTVSKGIAYTG